MYVEQGVLFGQGLVVFGDVGVLAPALRYVVFAYAAELSEQAQASVRGDEIQAAFEKRCW